MKAIFLLAVCMAMVGLTLTTADGADSLWVTSENAKLKSEGSASSETVSELSLGTRLTVLQSEGRWYQVRTVSGKEGWIYRGKVSDTPPAKETEDTENLFAGLQGSTISADEAQTSRSIRGLSKETAQYARHTGTPAAYQKALDQVLAMQLSTKEVDLFLKQGRIGEYAP